MAMTSSALNLTSLNEKKPPRSKPRTAANTFFHSPDLCILLTKTLLSTTTCTTHAIKPCQTPSPSTSLLPFRGITRSTYNAVMLDHPARVALGLDSQSESTAGVVVCLNPTGEGLGSQLAPYISHSEADISRLLTREIEEAQEEAEAEKERARQAEATPPPKQHATARQREAARLRKNPRLARIFTHHPAAAHQIPYDPRLSLECSGTTVHMTSESFFLGSILPLAREMFLTQPPQKRITFGVRYEYFPGTRRYFTLQNDEGIRFGELVEFFEREPGMMKQALDPNVGLGRYRRWLRDGEFIWMNRIEWEVGRGVAMGGELWKRAREMRVD